MVAAVFMMTALGPASGQAHSTPLWDNEPSGTWVGDANCNLGSNATETGTATLTIDNGAGFHFHGNISFSPWGFCDSIGDQSLWGTVNHDGSLSGTLGLGGTFFFKRINGSVFDYNLNPHWHNMNTWVSGQLVKQAG